MKRVAILCLLSLSIAARAQPTAPDAGFVRSMTGQFIVFRPAFKASENATPELASATNLLTLDPSVLVVSCERIKQAVWRELGLSSGWSGKVTISLRPALTADDPVTVVCNRFRDGWNYQMQLPQRVDRRRYLNAVVQTVLLELANRDAGRRSAEIPTWLSEGLTEQLLATVGVQIMPPPPRWGVRGVYVAPVQGEGSPPDALEAARTVLRANPPVTLENLSWPGSAQLAGTDGGLYRGSAQLFTMRLLQLQNGPACMRAMLGELSERYNWQTAFLRGFKPHFGALLDLEKWWALQLVQFANTDATRFWTTEESWRRLDEVLSAPTQVRRRTNELPELSQVKLQTAISDWSFANQRPMLNDKLRTLELLRFRVAPELAGLVGEYQQTLTDYLKERQRATFTLPGTRQPALTVKGTVRRAVRNLDALDEKRAALKPVPVPATTAAQ